MDLIKITAGRLLGFVASIIPGAAVLIVLGIHHPNWVEYFRNVAYLGYRTKVALVLGAAFLAGWTVNVAFGSLVGGITGGIWGALTNWISGPEPAAKPWQNNTWRTLLIAYLGDAAPENVAPISDTTLQMQIHAANQHPEPLRSQAIAEARMNKSRADVNDFDWRGWWRQLHHELTFKTDATGRIYNILTHNFQAASLLILFALPSTPILRHWWLEAACAFWLALIGFQTFSSLVKTRDPWSTYTDQIIFLRDRRDKNQTVEDEALL